MNIIQENIDTTIKLTNIEAEELVARIPRLYDKWDLQRQRQLDVIKRVQDNIDLTGLGSRTSENSFCKIKKIDEKSKMPDVLEAGESFKAHIWNSTFKTPSALFSVNSVPCDMELQNIDDEMAAAKQKISILDALNKSGSTKEFRKAVNNWTYKGEIIIFTGWKQKYKNIRRQVQVPKLDAVGNPIVEEITTVDEFGNVITLAEPVMQKTYAIQGVMAYDGVDIKVVDPEFFVFDTSRKDDFDNVGKIYKSWATYQSIVENKAYEPLLSQAMKDDLREIVDNKEDFKDNTDLQAKQISDRDKAVQDDMLEILEYWGDIKVGDQYLKNMLIVVVARKYVIRFEYNPFVINPWTYCPYYIDPESGRGLPFVTYILNLNEKSTELFYLIQRGIELSILPHFLSPKGLLSGTIKLEPGNFTEYDSELFPTQSPQAVPVNPSVGYNQMQFIEDKQEQTTGMFKYATGDPDAGAVTATEANGIISAQNIRIALSLSILGEDCIVSVIEKYAELLANFGEGSQFVRDSSNLFLEINDDVRQGDYEYSIGDTSSILEKKAKIQQLASVLMQLIPYAQSQGYGIDVPMLFDTLLSPFELTNPVSLLKPPLPPMTEPQPQAAPNAQKVKDLLAGFLIHKTNLPEEFKQLIDKELGLNDQAFSQVKQSS